MKRPTYAELRQQLADSLQREEATAKELQGCKRQLTEAFEQQTGTSAILRMIAKSPTDIQSVLDTMAEYSARLCGADDAVIWRVEGDSLILVAHFGSIRLMHEIGVGPPIEGGGFAGRAVREARTLHVHDLREAVAQFPGARERGVAVGVRTALAVPLLKDGKPLGIIHIRRLKVQPFTEQQIRLVETFADQAVIAIENVRLFQELKEALEQQTATSEILGVIASSPTDIQPVLDVVAENAARLCEASDAQIVRVDGDVLRVIASHGAMAVPSSVRVEGVPIRRDNVVGRALLDRRTVHVEDLAAEVDGEFVGAKAIQQATGQRTTLSTPLLREGAAIGAILIRRFEVRTFSEKHIKLLETFADQAVIAIENVRLFKELQERNAELREALEHQTATSEVLSIISRSPTDVQPVLDVIVESAARVCGIDDVLMRLRDGNSMVARAHFGPIPIGRSEVSVDTPPFVRLREHGTFHIRDTHALQDDLPSFIPPSTGWRTWLAVPLRTQGEFIGSLGARRIEVRPFTPAQVKLLETFADQAVIAIENVRLFQELKESLEQQTATSEILGVIASSPTDLQPVLDAIAQSAARVCGSDDATIRLIEEDTLSLVAHYGTIPPGMAQRPLGWRTPAQEAILHRRTVHIPDVPAEAERFPDSAPVRDPRDPRGIRTFLATPLLREGTAIGVINIRRTEVKPFTDKQVALLETFASQAVIAIENVRLFNQLQERNGELREALEHQTATAEVLGIISRSPTDVQPVLNAIVESAARVCGIDDVVLRLYEGNKAVARAHFGSIPIRTVEVSRDLPRFRWMREHGTLHVPDVRAQNESPLVSSDIGWRTHLSVPLRQQEELIGHLSARRTEVRPFTPAQIKLLETFADQAVIAIENVRLLNELRESLEQQTATSEILGVIASSPTDIQPVLEAVIKNAVKLAGAKLGHIRQYDGEFLQLVAYYNVGAEGVAALQETPVRPGRDTGPGRAFLERKPIHIPDVELDPTYRPPPFQARSLLAVPMLREGSPIGTISIWRENVMPFTERQIELVTIFADQAVIAIENVRLFKELETRNAELREALEHQTATSEVLGIISRSPTDVQPVLDAIVESAARVCGIDDVQLRIREGDKLISRAHFGSVPIPVGLVELDIGAPAPRWVREHGTLHIPDVREQNDIPFPLDTPARTFLAAPLRLQGEFIGGLVARRMEVRPFTPAQIKLLETFADQAVIAIENVRLFQELKESLEQQTATSEILSVIASSPTNIQPVLDIVAQNAARLCDASDALIFRVNGDRQQRVASYGSMPVMEETSNSLTRGSPSGRAMLDRETIHVHDLAASESDFPDAKTRGVALGVRTALVAPLLREGISIGAINVRRKEVRPFSEKQIALLKTFADQAVIAIENVRLFKEIQERNAELREALEHQTATSEVLSIISRSPTDVQPVLDAIVESAARVCGIDDVVLRLRERDAMVWRAHFGSITKGRVEVGIDEPIYRWLREHGTLHVPDAKAPNAFPVGSSGLFHSFLAVPLRQQGELIGSLNARRNAIRPFTSAQIKLLETFADQAVIAIENVRLFQELKEALEQQTSTSEILGVIASSPTDVQPVLEAVARSAARLCDAEDTVIYRVDGDVFQPAAICGPIPIRSTPLPVTRGSTAGRAVIDRRTVHIQDIQETSETDFPDIDRTGTRGGSRARTRLAVPLLREGVALGAILVRRMEVRPFTDKQVALLQTFADQSVIAIENARLFQELSESLEQQTATSEILGVIASSPTDIQPVLDAVAATAARLCDARDVLIDCVEGDVLEHAAVYGPMPVAGSQRPLTRATPAGRAIIDRQTIHIDDIMPLLESEFPEITARQQVTGTRTALVIPLLREGLSIGAITIRRPEVRPFSEKQIALLKTFADQAVIAIENVRLFKELQERNAELHEALEHQTATAEVLGIISRSPTDVQPVLDAIVESAAKICGIDDVVLRLHDGNIMVPRAHFGSVPMGRVEISIDEPQYQWMREHGTLHIPDVRAQNDFPMLGAVSGSRTLLRVPLLQKGELIGTLGTRRTEVRPFTPAQIKLLETFANQAVIAIENVRLFQELKESLEQQTATSEILSVIASSPTEIQPVLDTVAENAARLCEATDAQIRLVDGEVTRLAASFGTLAAPETRPITLGNPSGRAILTRQTLHIPDLQERKEEFPDAVGVRRGLRTFLSAPMLREGTPIGVINIRRMEMRPFSDRHIKLLETFASQAVIAIENVRLFQELEARTRDLAKSVGELRALGDVGQTVSSTLDLEKVLATIVSHAVQLSGCDCGVIYEYDESAQEFNLRASHRMEEEVVEGLRAARVRLGEGATGRAAITRTPVQIPDILDQREFTGTRARPLINRFGYRSLLSVPLLREHQTLGGLTVLRRQTGEFKPEVVNLLQTFATQSALAIHNARLFREIAEKGRQIEAANRHKSEFLANMSHELRTPLNAIIGFSEVLQEKLFGELNEKQAEYTEDILSSGQHLLSLINEILDLSKVEAGRMELELGKFDLPLTIDNARTFVRERATKHGITLDVHVDERLADFVGDERKIKQILLNLLSNAVKFTPEGGRIGIHARQADGAVEISVSDTGIGIAPEDQARIFEEFRQVGGDYVHKKEGTGLGLTLAKKFVELHGGRIWLESEIGKGSTFTFALPMNPQPFPPGGG